jgi:hypothetical protein
MAFSGVRELIIENRHNGERLAMRRVKRGDEVWLELKGSLPPRRQGPPLHIHLAEDEEGSVRSGTLSALDRFLQAIFEVLNAGSDGRPPLFYMAHLLLRHRHTQTLLIMPRPIQAVLFRVIVTVGTLLGRYRGDGWPGCPSRCVGAPFAAEELT